MPLQEHTRQGGHTGREEEGLVIVMSAGTVDEAVFVCAA